MNIQKNNCAIENNNNSASTNENFSQNILQLNTIKSGTETKKSNHLFGKVLGDSTNYTHISPRIKQDCIISLSTKNISSENATVEQLIHALQDKENQTSNTIHTLITHIPHNTLGQQDKEGNTCLHIAVKQHNLSAIEKLIQAMDKEQLAITNKIGKTAIASFLNIQKKKIDSKLQNSISQLWIEKMDSNGLSKQDKDKNTILHILSKQGNESLLKLVLQKIDKQRIGIKNNNEETALTYSFGLGKKNRITQLLLENSDQKEILEDILVNHKKQQKHLPSLIKCLEKSIIDENAIIQAIDNDIPKALFQQLIPQNEFHNKCITKNVLAKAIEDDTPLIHHLIESADEEILNDLFLDKKVITLAYKNQIISALGKKVLLTGKKIVIIPVTNELQKKRCISTLQEWKNKNNVDIQKLAPKAIEKIKKDTPLIYIAKDNENETVGMLIATPQTGKSTHIDYLLTHPDKQSSGVGSSLLKKIASQVQKKVIDTTSLSLNSVQSACGFYTHIGFKRQEGNDFVGDQETMMKLCEKQIPQLLQKKELKKLLILSNIL